MRWRLALLLLAVAALATAGGGAAHTAGPTALRGGEEPSHLDDVLDDLAWAIDHEEDGDDAFHAAGGFADYYGAGQLLDSTDHLEDALGDLADAVSAGEIDAVTAGHVADHIHEALGQDDDALDTITSGGTVGHTLAHVHEALAQKEDAGDLVYYGDQVEAGDEGCSLSYDSIGGGDWFAGFDGCLRPISRLIVDPGFAPLRVSEGMVGEGNRIVETFPCRQLLGLISCTPSKPVVRPEYLFVDFGPAPAAPTAARAIAVGVDGKAQISPFAFSGSGAKATTDLGLTGTVFHVTPRGLVTPPKQGASWTFGTGQTYGFDFQIANYSAVPATGAKLDITLPTGFRLLGSYPTACKQSGSVLDCQLGTLRATDADSVLVWGTAGPTGASTYGATLASDASEPAGDRNPNSYSAPLTVYPVPSARLEKLSRSILAGDPGKIFGSASVGSKFLAKAPKVTKVEVAFLKLTGARGKCAWVTTAGKLAVSKKQFKTCTRGVWMPARGTSKWTFALRKGLAPGRYEVLARATNAAGLTQSVFSGTKRSEATLTIR